MSRERCPTTDEQTEMILQQLAREHRAIQDSDLETCSPTETTTTLSSPTETCSGGVVEHQMRPYVIGVCGATASGKTTLCETFRRKLQKGGLTYRAKVAFVPADAFYKSLTPEQKDLAHKGQFDFDHPDAIAFDELTETVRELKRGNSVVLPKYDFITHSRVECSSLEEPQSTDVLDSELSTAASPTNSKSSKCGGGPGLDKKSFYPKTKLKHRDLKGATTGGVVIEPADVIIVEGILIFAAGAELRDEMDLKIFVDCDSDVILARRMKRDREERGRDLDQIMHQYMKFVKPSFDNFIEPSKRFSDVIIPNTKDDMDMDNKNALGMIVHHIKHELMRRHVGRETSGRTSPETQGQESSSLESSGAGSARESDRFGGNNKQLVLQWEQVLSLAAANKGGETTLPELLQYFCDLANSMEGESLVHRLESDTPTRLCGQPTYKDS